MRREGFTLLELIFSMVIIAIAFTVLPKMLQMAAKVSKQSVKEEAIYSAVALLGLVKSTAWDEQNTKKDDILLVSSDGDAAYSCSDYRVGSFIGSRNCKNALSASSSLGMDGDDGGVADDMDDFIGEVNTTGSAVRKYTISVGVDYVEDISLNGTQFSTTTKANPTNTKYIVIDVNATNRESAVGNHIARFYYIANNIGQIQINRRAW